MSLINTVYVSLSHEEDFSSIVEESRSSCCLREESKPQTDQERLPVDVEKIFIFFGHRYLVTDEELSLILESFQFKPCIFLV